MPKQKTEQKPVDAQVKTPKNTVKKTSFYEGVGRRKEAGAVVRLYVPAGDTFTLKGKTLKKGDMVVNTRPIEEYFRGEVNKKIYIEPFRTTNTIGRFITSAQIEGGGSSAQLSAFILGSARALEKVDKEKFRNVLKKRGFMTRDARIKQRRKAGYAQKARARKQSPKR